MVLFKEAIVHPTRGGEVANLIFEGQHLFLEGGDLGIAFAEEGFGLFVGDLDNVSGSGLAGVVELEERHDVAQIWKL